MRAVRLSHCEPLRSARQNPRSTEIMNYAISRKARGGQGCRLEAKLVAGLRKCSQTPAVGGLMFLC